MGIPLTSAKCGCAVQKFGALPQLRNMSVDRNKVHASRFLGKWRMLALGWQLSRRSSPASLGAR